MSVKPSARSAKGKSLAKILLIGFPKVMTWYVIYLILISLWFIALEILWQSVTQVKGIPYINNAIYNL